MKLDRAVRRRMLARCLLLQAGWDGERMQGLGWAYALDPWLRRCWKEPDSLREARLRHQTYFNTQPFMAPMLLGMICALEEKAAGAPARERAALIARLCAVKTTAAAALAGVGDALFWATLRPFCAALALATGLFTLRRLPPGTAALSAALAYLVSYNALSGLVRWRGLSLGYRWGEELPVRLREYSARVWIRRLRWATLLLAVAAMGLSVSRQGARGATAGLLVLAASAAAFRWLAFTPARAYGAAAAISVLLAAAGRIP